MTSLYTPYEGSYSANQNDRKLGVSNRKLEGSPPLNIVIFIIIMTKRDNTYIYTFLLYNKLIEIMKKISKTLEEGREKLHPKQNGGTRLSGISGIPRSP